MSDPGAGDSEATMAFEGPVSDRLPLPTGPAAGIVLDWPLKLIVLLGAGGAGISLALAFVLSWPVDRRIRRMRKFAEGLLEAGDEPAGASMLGRLGVDELEALDRSLLRMAGQTRVLVERVQGRKALRFVSHGFYEAGGPLKSVPVKKRETIQSCSACCICSSLPAKK